MAFFLVLNQLLLKCPCCSYYCGRCPCPLLLPNPEVLGEFSNGITINRTANIYRYPTGGSTIALAATSTIDGSVASGAAAIAY